MGKGKIEDAEELNLLPIMNLMTILIPMLLMSAQFVSLAVIDSTLPAISNVNSAPSEAQPEEQKPDEQPLMLTVFIASDGFTIAGNDPDLMPPADGSGAAAQNKVPCTGECATPDSYDYKGLTAKLGAIKGRHVKEENVILVPSPKLPYEVLVRVMDAAREDTVNRTADGKAKSLFPYVVIAGGAE